MLVQIPGSGRSPGGEHNNPLQYSCLENPTDRRAWRATVHRITKSRTWLKQPHMWDLSSLTRDQTHILCIASWILNHWTTRQVPPKCALGRVSTDPPTFCPFLVSLLSEVLKSQCFWFLGLPGFVFLVYFGPPHFHGLLGTSFLWQRRKRGREKGKEGKWEGGEKKGEEEERKEEKKERKEGGMKDEQE